MQPKGGAKIVKVGGGRECNLLSRRRRTAGEMDKPALGFGEFSEELMGWSTLFNPQQKGAQQLNYTSSGNRHAAQTYAANR